MLRNRTRYVAEVGREIAGTVSVGPDESAGSAALTAMWVDPGFRRRGVGRLLVRTAVDWARANSYQQILLWVTAVNTGAERMYERSGFHRTGEAKDVRPGELEYEMRLSL